MMRKLCYIGEVNVKYLFLQAVLIQTTHIGADEKPDVPRLYINLRIRDALHSLEHPSSKGRDFDPPMEPIIITGSAVVQNRTRSFKDILASARNPKERRFNNGIRYLGVENFLSAALKFCEEETRDGRIDIVSIGSHDGYVEKNIEAAYYESSTNRSSYFNMILVDPDDTCESVVNYSYVDDLIRERPRVVGHCVLFIFCPEPAAKNDGYDIDAIRKLKPTAVLAEYDATGESGSIDLVRFLDTEEQCDEFNKERGLENYPTKEILLQVKWMGMDIRLTKMKTTS